MFKTSEEFPIHKLCSKDIQYQFEILSSIYNNINGNRIEELIKNTNLSRKTIYKYIQIINSNSESLFQKSIILSDRNVYWFDGNKVDFVTLRLNLLKNSTPIKLIESLLQNSSVNVYKFCLENFVSESTLKNNIRMFNIFMNDIGIRLRVKKNEIYLVGDEAKIRYCFTSIFWRSFYGIEWPFPTLSKSKLEKITSFIFKNFENKVSKAKQEIFSYLLAINILRGTSGNYISSSTLPPYSLSLLTNDIFFNQFSKILIDNYSIPRVDAQFIMLNLYTFPEYHILTKKISNTLDSIKHKSLESYVSIMDFTNDIRKKHPDWNYQSENGRLFQAVVISGRISVDIFKEIYFHIYDLDLITYCSNEFPSLLPNMQIIVSKSNKTLSKGMLKSLVFRYAQAYVAAFPPQNFEPQINILFTTDLPIYIENLLLKRIKLLLSSKYNFKIITSTDDYSSIDLILTTSVINDMSINTPILYIFPHLSRCDSQSIVFTCEEILKMK